MLRSSIKFSIYLCLSVSLLLYLYFSLFLVLSILCVLGRSESQSLRKQGFWGSCRGNMYVPGKNIFISFHMDGAWWAWFNVPWVWGVVRLYSIFYYLMGKCIVTVRHPWYPQSCLIPPLWKNKLFSSFSEKNWGWGRG